MDLARKQICMMACIYDIDAEKDMVSQCHILPEHCMHKIARHIARPSRFQSCYFQKFICCANGSTTNISFPSGYESTV